jgi:hypothetical protein
LIVARYNQGSTITLIGHLCGGDGRPLRFWYRESGLPAPLPMTERQMRDAGDLTGILPTLPAGGAHMGYFMFSTSGVWAVTVSQGTHRLGAFLVDVMPA